MNRPGFEPGTKSAYSNIGLGLVGHVLSLKTGIPLNQLLKDRIWNVITRNEWYRICNECNKYIRLPENIVSKFAKGHMIGNESELIFLPQEVQGAGANVTQQLMIY